MVENDQIRVRGQVISKDCREMLEENFSGPLNDPGEVGRKCAVALLEKGALQWMADWRVAPGEDEAERIIMAVNESLREKQIGRAHV